MGVNSHLVARLLLFYDLVFRYLCVTGRFSSDVDKGKTLNSYFFVNRLYLTCIIEPDLQ